MNRRLVMALLALVGLFIGTYLTLYKLGYVGALTCSIGSCEKVQTSRWSEFLGVPVATWGLGYYAVILSLTLAGSRERYTESRRLSLALLVLSGWGVLFSGWLTYLELSVIHAICEWCVISAIVATILFLLAIIDWRETRELEAVVVEG